MNKIVMVIAPEKFHDDEYSITREVLENHEIEVDVASLNVDKALGYKKLEVKPDLNIEGIKNTNYDGIVIIGGFGVKNYLWSNKKLHNVIKGFYESKKLIGAICLAPVCLANSGILNGKKACVYKNKHGIQAFNEHNVDYVSENVVITENIITANGPKASKQFGETIVKNIF